MFPDGKDRMDNQGSSEETNCSAVDVDVGISDRCIRKIQKQPSKTSNKNDGPTVPGIKKMSLACMQASSERLSKNFDRKMSKPIIKKESNVNVDDKQLKKVPNMMTTATVPRSVSEVTKTRLLVLPLTPEPARLKHQCIHENTDTVSYMPSKKDVAVQTFPLPLFQQQPAEMSSTDGRHPPQPLISRKRLNNDAPFKDIVEKFDKFIRKNMKTTIQFKKYIDNLSPRRIVAAASTHDYWKYLMYFSTFSIGVISTYMLNYGWYHLQRIKNTPHLLK
ncbi:uncharacterized protein LOC132944224 [Metopolophium dirhodum]|uniref:uncharacterized protein LOC132944224 n=1 Tax=Metopolophium dirhodum TaxID=44670 RepID=UPI00298F3F33|nr:uncharacterized protein LOC132944224 [Metopolophium dirhodum]